VVDGVPVTTADKVEKLMGVLRKILGGVGDIRDDGIYMPMNADGSENLGYVFVEYDSPESAQRAVREIDGFVLAKKNTFRVNPFEDLERYARVPDEYAPPPEATHSTHDQLHSWLTDRRGRDQFALQFGSRTQVCWNWAQRKEFEVAYERDYWTDFFWHWSPMGNMMATTHRQGIAVWGGPDFTRLQKFEHAGIRYLNISPGENYIVSMSVQETKRGSKLCLRVLNTRTAQLLRQWEGPAEEIVAPGVAPWPVLHWCGDREDRYVAKVAPSGDAIQVYEAPEMTLLDKKSIRLEGLGEFQWSPRDPIIAAYQHEDAEGNRPARVVLVKIPERVEIRQKNLFSVAEAKLYWHPQGDYLAVKVEKRSKTGKTTTPAFELFRMNERDVPMEVLELPVKTHAVAAFAWEPRGHRFCVIHGEGSRKEVSFYTMEGVSKAGVKQVQHVNTLKNKTCNTLFWSPLGKNLVIAHLQAGATGGQLEFFNVEEMASMANEEHFMCQGGAWDPSGRYFASWVDQRAQMENGFMMRSFNGKILYKESYEVFNQFQWRPRPPSLLTPDEERKVAKDLRKFTRRFEAEDEALLNEADAEVLRRREEQYEAWRTWQQRRSGIVEARKALTEEKYRFLLERGPFEVTEVEREEVVEVNSTVVA